MLKSILALPVSIEQIAAVIKQMSYDDQKRLLELVPTLQQISVQPSSTKTNFESKVESKNLDSKTNSFLPNNIAKLQADVLAITDAHPISPNDVFIGGLTVTEYNALPDEKKGKLWDDSTNIDLMDIDEQEVGLDALPA